jgi:hypothetical protein
LQIPFDHWVKDTKEEEEAGKWDSGIGWQGEEGHHDDAPS